MPLYFRGLCSSCFIDSKSVVWPKPDIGAGSTAEYCKLLAVTAAQQNNVCCTLVFTHDKVEKSCKIWLLLSGSRFSGNLGGECSAAQTARWQDFFSKISRLFITRNSLSKISSIYVFNNYHKRYNKNESLPFHHLQALLPASVARG